MSSFTINLEWKNSSSDFIYEKYNRTHQIFLSGDQKLKNSAAPEFFGDANATNPEELLASALASCHMLTFLAVASKSGYVVSSYQCKAEAVMEKNDEGKMAITQINLTPVIIFSGDKVASPEQLKNMHEKSHKNCFIAQSIKAKVNVL